MTDYRKVFFSAATNEAKVALGELTVQWGLLEAMIEAGIWKAMQVPYDVGRSATSQMQLMAKMDTLQSILHQTNPHLAAQFELTANYIRNWPAAGSVDTELRCLMELEVSDAEKEVQPRVQA